MRKIYPSDISREQFETIKPLLESARRKTAPRRVDLYEVFCAVLYLLRSGCQWRMLPEECPKWRTVHAYFARRRPLGARIPCAGFDVGEDQEPSLSPPCSSGRARFGVACAETNR